MATTVAIVSRCDLTIEECHIESNIIRKIYCCIIHSFHFHCHLKQLYISIKTDQFSYKGVCDVRGYTHIEGVKRRASFDYRQKAWVIRFASV